MTCEMCAPIFAIWYVRYQHLVAKKDQWDENG
eukprot:SAG31_NODE_41536_length_275_cov_1.170455_1_plen_31_part_01